MSTFPGSPQLFSSLATAMHAAEAVPPCEALALRRPKLAPPNRSHQETRHIPTDPNDPAVPGSGSDLELCIACANYAVAGLCNLCRFLYGCHGRQHSGAAPLGRTQDCALPLHPCPATVRPVKTLPLCTLIAARVPLSQVRSPPPCTLTSDATATRAASATARGAHPHGQAPDVVTRGGVCNPIYTRVQSPCCCLH